MKHEYPFLLNIGFDKFLPYHTIIGIFNATNVEGFKENSNVLAEMTVEENRPVKSYLYCEGGFLIGSPIESKTLKGRYESFQNEVNGLSENKNLYIKIN